MTVPMKLIGQCGTVLDQPTPAYESLQRNCKDARPLPDFIAQMYGFEDRKQARNAGLHIRCLATTQLAPYLLFLSAHLITWHLNLETYVNTLLTGFLILLVLAVITLVSIL